MNQTSYKKKELLVDEYYMKKAIQLAKRGKYSTAPNPNVGCVIIQKKKIVGIGWHKKSGDHHAEVNAINMAGKLAKNSTAYITLEPCNHFGKTPPCCNTIITCGIKRVVVAMLDPNPKMSGKSIKILKKNNIKVTVGVLSKQSKNINLGYLKRIKTGIPWIQLKMAISMDGKIATQNGDSQWITGHLARQDAHQFRALSNAILSTSNTVLKDNAILTARNNNQILKKYIQPIRVIIDSKNRIQPNHKIIKETISEVWLIRIYRDQYSWPNHVKQIILPNDKDYVDLKTLFQFLGMKQINTLWVECGAKLFSSIIQLKLVDEIILYIAPKMLGNLSKSLYYNETYTALKQANIFSIKNIKQVGCDIRVKLKPKF